MQMITSLANNQHRILAPLDIFFSLLPNISERTILILCSRLSGVNLITQYIKEKYSKLFGGEDAVCVLERCTTQIKRSQNRHSKANARVLICTDKLVSEGFDEARIDTLIRVLPSNESVQTYGRAMRTHATKQMPVWFCEVVDMDSEWLINMYKSRKRVLSLFTREKRTFSESTLRYEKDFSYTTQQQKTETQPNT